VRDDNGFLESTSLENKIEEGRHEINLEGVGETREEIESNKISNDESEEEWSDGVIPEMVASLPCLGGATVEEPVGKKIWSKSNKEPKYTEYNSNQASF